MNSTEANCFNTIKASLIKDLENNTILNINRGFKNQRYLTVNLKIIYFKILLSNFNLYILTEGF